MGNEANNFGFAKRVIRKLLIVFLLLCVFLILEKISMKPNQSETIEILDRESRLILLPQEDVSEEKIQINNNNVDMSCIHVLIKNQDFRNIYHDEVKLYCEGGLKLTYFDKKKECSARFENIINISFTAADFRNGICEIRVEAMEKDGQICISNLQRGQGKPEYSGCLSLREENEAIVLINEIGMEEYLYSVVPSEMPADYPIEALKAQAVCARTYAAKHIQNPGYPEYGAHLDDSTSFQVYNNIKMNSKTNQAVDETRGLLIYVQGELADTYYYSTSCGVGSDCRVWKNKDEYNPTYLRARHISKEIRDGRTDLYFDNDTFREFILKRNENDYEKDLRWYRWKYYVVRIEPDEILSGIKERYAETPNLILSREKNKYMSLEPKKLGKIKNIFVAKRGAGGVADELVVVGDKGTYKIVSEYNIRKILNSVDGYAVTQDGSIVRGLSMLPSAFFSIETGINNENVVEYTLSGGGFGHGVGMSQNAACMMAEAGLQMNEIVKFFYDGCEIHE